MPETESRSDHVTEATIARLVDTFYERVRRDPVLAPVFETAINPPDWPEHLSTMRRFWSSVMLASGRYSGNPVAVHRAVHGIERAMFTRWINLFEATARDLFTPVLFAGCYALIVVFCLASIVLLRFIAFPVASAAAQPALARPLRVIVGQPMFLMAASAGMIAYGMMSLVMTATPLAMLGCGLSFEDAAFVIQWHALGMYAPSFVTGHLIDRFGAIKVMITGVGLLGSCAAIALSGIAVTQFWLALVLLGIGWNFLLIGSTALLTGTYSAAERAKTQAANDFLIFGMVALSSFSSGVMLDLFGWNAVNLLILPFAGTILIVLLFYLRWQGSTPRRVAV